MLADHSAGPAARGDVAAGLRPDRDQRAGGKAALAHQLLATASMTSTRLHSHEWGDTGPTVVFLHGLFGQGKNWTSIAKALADSHRVLLVDLPNHGRSAWTEHFSYPDTASAVAELIDNHATSGDGYRSVAVVGHSMGGKVAMALALEHPRLVERLCVVDVSPVRYSTLSSFADFIRGMRQLDLERLTDRDAAEQALEPYVRHPADPSYLLKNLRRVPTSATDPDPTGPGWRWQMNLELLDDQLGELGDWPDHWSEPYPGPTLWMAGANSRYVVPEYSESMRALFPRVQLVTVKNAGHWVHSDQPEVFVRILRRFLGAPPSSPAGT